MKGINNKPYIDLSPFVNVSYLKEIEDEITLGLAKGYKFPVYFGKKIDSKDDFDLLKTKYDINDLTLEQKIIYLKLKEKYHNGSMGLSLRSMATADYTNFLETICRQDKTKATDNCKLFPKLIDWIYGQSLFTEVGRIIFFLLDHNSYVAAHQDSNSGYVPHRSEFIYITLNKLFYILDENSMEKHYVNAPISFWNTLDYHGADPKPEMTWSLRIDGVFTNEFRKQVGLENIEYY